MKIVIIITVSLLQIANCQTAFGIKYDAARVAKLKHSLDVQGKDVMPISGDVASIADCVVDVDEKLFKKIDTLLSKDGDFNNGFGDSGYQPFSLILYKEGKVVLTVTPNVLGGDIYATDKSDKFDPRSFSKQQMTYFLDICFQALSMDRKKTRATQ